MQRRVPFNRPWLGACRAARRTTSRTRPRLRPRAPGPRRRDRPRPRPSSSSTWRAPSTSASTVRATVPWSSKASIVAVGHGVDRVGADELVDVERVGVGGVLGRRRRPQRALHLGALRGQRLPAGAGERLEEELVGQLGLGDGGLAPQRPGSAVPMASSRLSTSVSTREMKNDATLRTADRSSCPASRSASRPGEVGLHDLGVAVEQKISVTLMLRPSPIIWLDGRDALGRGRDLHEQVGLRRCARGARGPAAMVPSVSWARPGATSTETKPSTAAGRVVHRAAATAGPR